MAAGGKAYGSRSSQDRLSASTAHVWGSGASEKKLWQFVVEPDGKQVHLGLVPLAAYGLEDIWVKGPFCLNGQASLDSLSAIIFSEPGMCQALRVTLFLVHQVTERARLHPNFFVYIDNHCSVAIGYQNYVVLELF